MCVLFINNATQYDKVKNYMRISYYMCNTTIDDNCIFILGRDFLRFDALKYIYSHAYNNSYPMTTQVKEEEQKNTETAGICLIHVPITKSA